MKSKHPNDRPVTQRADVAAAHRAQPIPEQAAVAAVAESQARLLNKIACAVAEEFRAKRKRHRPPPRR